MSRQEIDPTISSFVVEHYPQADNIESLDIGHHSHAFRFKYENAGYVMRLSPKDDHFYRDDFIFKQFGHILPVAEILSIGHFTDEQRYYCISRQLMGDKLAQLSPVGEKVSRSFSRQLTEISQVDVARSSGFGKVLKSGGQFESWRKFLQGAWSQQDAVSTLKLQQQIKDGKFERAVFDEAKSAMTELTAETYEQRHLIHGDFQPHNILIAGQKVSAVLDWGNAKYGDFAYDIVWTSMHPPQIASEAELLKQYAESNFDMTDIENRILAVKISIFVSWAMFSNEIGNFEESKKYQRDLAELLR